MILVRGFQLTHVQHYGGSTAKMVLSYKMQYICGGLEHLPAFSARTFLVLSHNNRSETAVVETIEQM
jgi:hypothetical protein